MYIEMKHTEATTAKRAAATETATATTASYSTNEQTKKIVTIFDWQFKRNIIRNNGMQIYSSSF